MLVLPTAFAVRPEKPAEHLGGHGEIGIEDGQQRLISVREPKADSVGFAFARLLQSLDAKLPTIKFGRPQNLSPGVVGGVSFDEDHFHRTAQVGHAFQCVLNIAPFVAGGNHARNNSRCLRDDGAEHRDVGKGKPAQHR